MNLENDSTCEEEISRTDFTSYDNESYLVDPPDDADVEDVESVVEVSTEQNDLKKRVLIQVS